ncbi:unnamed protein product [Dovyalis caffra]|uniref:Uncharacterized protein n=1 Tax=Dovyalis caffra TaxID=77055 RepID=A0AAV1RJB6_9ROSI|nr:unnamed protein product [Dovyalis caffra]
MSNIATTIDSVFTEVDEVAGTPSPRLSICYDCSCFQRTTSKMLEGIRAHQLLWASKPHRPSKKAKVGNNREPQYNHDSVVQTQAR